MRSLFFICLLIITACQKKPGSREAAVVDEPRRFERLKPEQTGIDFVNRLTERPDLNIFTYLYIYNGAGVAAGDVNNDGLPDLYFTSNQEKNKLYLNRGNFRFEDVTEAAQAGGEFGWTTGVTMADVNADGKLDIYVSMVGGHPGLNGRNLLLINKGNDAKGVPLFENEAARYGLDLVGYSTQAAFFDYDSDGDLDMYQLRHSVHKNGTFGTRAQLRDVPHPTAGDKLLRNDDGRFTDVTTKAGIYSPVTGYGLGISTGDVNLDGYPDIYIGNDFHEDDFLYLNQGDGTFREALNESIRHTSRFTMGTDIADFNNDGLPDIVSLDMLPDDPKIRKASAAEDAPDVFQFKLSYGYNYQYARNNLQLNTGWQTQEKGPALPFFTEMACYADVYATDWSWSALLCDLDLDSYKDLYISNGIFRRSNDLDYMKFVEVDSVQVKITGNEIGDSELKLTELMPRIKIPNYAYRNDLGRKGTLTFTNVAAAWGMDVPSYSNGTVYADLDNDGDLDIVVNNLDDPAFLYKNLTLDAQKAVSPERHYLKVKFTGSEKNTQGIGAKVVFDTPKGRFLGENFPTRGYQSAVEPGIWAGLGDITSIEKVQVIWPDGRFQILQNVAADQTLQVRYSDAAGRFDYKSIWPTAAAKPLLSELTGPQPWNYRHRENKFVEFNRERLIPNMNSTEGPKIAVGDLNGDGLEDLYAAGAKWQAGTVWLQQKNGNFQVLPQPALEADSLNEDTGVLMFDADGDKDTDLAVISGGNEFSEREKPMQPRLYLNDGKGRLSRAADAFGDIALNAGCIAGADYDGDGDTDLFIGGRTLTRNYGLPPRSFLLENDGKGRFTDITSAKAPGLLQPGLLKDALWTDLNGDQRPDLVLAGEWMPISVFMGESGGGLQPLAEKDNGLQNTHGWWNCVRAADFDGDGDADLLCGNYGLNSKIKAAPEEPVEMYVKDLDGNGSLDQLLCYYLHGEKHLFATKDELNAQMPSIKKKYLKYKDYAAASLHDVFPAGQLKDALLLQATQFASCYVENLGNGRFSVRPLPETVQLAPLQTALLRDFNKDGYMDALTGGNFYDANPEIGRIDGNYGTLLLGDGKGGFRAAPAWESGVHIVGQCRDLQEIRTPKGTWIIAACNNDTFKVLRE
jgi:hypothetical protein